MKWTAEGEHGLKLGGMWGVAGPCESLQDEVALPGFQR